MNKCINEVHFQVCIFVLIAFGFQNKEKMIRQGDKKHRGKINMVGK